MKKEEPVKKSKVTLKKKKTQIKEEIDSDFSEPIIEDDNDNDEIIAIV